MFNYDGERTLTLRVGSLVPVLPPGSDPATLPSAGAVLPIGDDVTVTWDPDLSGATEVPLQVSADGGATWTTVATEIDPSTGTLTHTPDYATYGPDGLAILGQTVELRLVATNDIGGELALGATTAVVDFGAPDVTIAPGVTDFLVGQEEHIHYDATNAASAELQLSTDDGATWTPVASSTANPTPDQSQLWTDFFAWTPTEADVSYGARLQVVVTHRDGTQTAEAMSDPITVAPGSLDFMLGKGFQMRSLPLGAPGLNANQIFVDGSTSGAVTPLFLYSYAPSTFYTLLDNTEDDAIVVAQGFWAGSGVDASGTFYGTPFRTAQSVALAEAGAYMIGIPFALSVTTDELAISDGTETKPYADAITDGWIAAGLYTWDGSAYVDATASSLEPWAAH
ncbi:MAG: hypothetical protein Rubg2KO_22980 [Rubricoccaceae bacterium]